MQQKEKERKKVSAWGADRGMHMLSFQKAGIGVPPRQK